jgi:chaperonin cofactor prefoldin
MHVIEAKIKRLKPILEGVKISKQSVIVRLNKIKLVDGRGRDYNSVGVILKDLRTGEERQTCLHNLKESLNKTFPSLRNQEKKLRKRVAKRSSTIEDNRREFVNWHDDRCRFLAVERRICDRTNGSVRRVLMENIRNKKTSWIAVEKARRIKSGRGFSDLSQFVGQKFNKLTILSVFRNKKSKRIAICECECGNKKERDLDNLIKGGIKSCGCIKRGRPAKEKNKIIPEDSNVVLSDEKLSTEKDQKVKIEPKKRGVFSFLKNIFGKNNEN